MKKVLFSFILALALTLSNISFAGAVSKTITSENDWTNSIAPLFKNQTGYINVSVSGTWVGVVTLQRRFQEGAWMDVKSWEVNTEKALEDKESGVQYRLGIKTGEFTSGAAVVRLSN